MTDFTLSTINHLLDIESLSPENIEYIFSLADQIKQIQNPLELKKTLQGRSIANLFFEPSTRTRFSFELAAKQLGADVLNFSENTSAVQKGEALLDTALTFQAMNIDALVIRHPENNCANWLAEHLGDRTTIINAGDGTRAHPTQTLLDLYTIREFKPNFANLCVVIVGDIAHSRVANSLLYGLTKLQTTNITLVAPPNIAPSKINFDHVTVTEDFNSALVDCDVIVMLRIQKERMLDADIPNTQEYVKRYCLTPERLKLAKPDAIVMHPGPMNREIEIDPEVADSEQSVILRQVTNGVLIRMAVLQFAIL